MTRQLLIHSMAEFHSITLPILNIIQAKRIAEIGTEHGGNTKLLYDWVKQQQGQLFSIDPCPSPVFYQWLEQTGNFITHIEKMSLNAIDEIGVIDAWFIDGDHNWYTVFHELQSIHALAEKNSNQPVIFLHDVCWPCGRRDAYYAPERIPQEYLHPHTWEEGVTLDHNGVITGGFRGEGQFAFALHAGGEKNGVLTAVEDFLKLYQTEYCFALIPAVFGLGVIFKASHPKAEQLSSILLPYHQNSLLATLEENRLMNYLTVIEWQDQDTAKSL